MKLAVIFIFSIFVIAVAAACTENKTSEQAANADFNAKPSATAPIPAATIDEIASGKKVYEQSCANCHKPDGSGGMIEVEGKKVDADDLTGDKIKKFSDEKILGYIINGIPDEGMPAFKGTLSEGEMRDVVKYMRVEFHKQVIGKK